MKSNDYVYIARRLLIPCQRPHQAVDRLGRVGRADLKQRLQHALQVFEAECLEIEREMARTESAPPPLRLADARERPDYAAHDADMNDLAAATGRSPTAPERSC